MMDSGYQDSWNSLHSAAREGQVDVCQMIVDNVRDKNPMNSDGTTPLHVAAEHNQPKICRIIMRHLKDMHPIDRWGWSPLHWAVSKGHYEVCLAILEIVHRTHQTRNPSHDTGGYRTPLHVAVQYDRPRITNLLLKSAVEKNPPDEDGVTPLHLAARDGKLQLCKLILSVVQDKNPLDKSGVSPLHLAKQRSFRFAEAYLKLLDGWPGSGMKC